MEKNKSETGFSSDAKKEPRRVVFVTKKTSAKVVGDRGPQLMTYPHLLIREAIALQVLVIAFILLAFLAVFHAWTIFVPTAVVAALLLFSYTVRHGREGWLNALATKPLSWWVMTWFIAVAICLTVVGTFFRGPGWSWVWPWRTHAG